MTWIAIRMTMNRQFCTAVTHCPFVIWITPQLPELWQAFFPEAWPELVVVDDNGLGKVGGEYIVRLA